MLDATKSPTPTWQRYLVALLVTVLIVVVGYVVWTKELHHTTAGASVPAPAPAVVHHSGTAQPPARPAAAPTPTTTTIPGGLAVSARDPFGG